MAPRNELQSEVEVLTANQTRLNPGLREELAQLAANLCPIIGTPKCPTDDALDRACHRVVGIYWNVRPRAR